MAVCDFLIGDAPARTGARIHLLPGVSLSFHALTVNPRKLYAKKTLPKICQQNVRN
jgi:hypothetical protein